jgi:glycosyltransferase involved in cell wall biosynthesis
MKVLFDHQLFSYQRFGGASKYFAMLLNSLPRNAWETTTLFSNNEYVRHLNLFSPISFFKSYFFKGQGRIMNELNKPYSIYRLKKNHYDVFHQTHFETYCLKSIGNKPMVTTFHDINFSTLNSSPKIVRLQKKSLERADKIIVISKNTKQDLIRLFDIKEDKIVVIYHGIKSPKKQLHTKRLINDTYILYVGSRVANKNFLRLLEAFALLAKNHLEIKLVCTQKGFSKKEYDLFKKLGIETRIIHIFATENMMDRLYREALFFVFPSLYEGFGMPILEAWINNCPIALSNTSCFPEIAENAGKYFDPEDIYSIKNAMDELINDEKLRNNLRQLGTERVKEFSWEKCAQQHMEVYQSLL